jgi:uncharacterized membrane protein YbhN (UPF0104 family)
MGRWIRNLLGLVILGLLVWYLARRWETLRALVRLDLPRLAALYVLCFLGSVVMGRVVYELLGAMGSRTRVWDMIGLHNASSLLNYLPLRFGTLFRADYLKRHYGVSYTRFAVFLVIVTLLIVSTAGGAGLLALVGAYGLATTASRALAAVLLVAILGALVLLRFDLPLRIRYRRLQEALEQLRRHRRDVLGAKRALFATSGLLLGNTLLAAARLGVIYHSLGQDLQPAGFVILGSLGFVGIMVGLTPGALGIREVILGTGATILGVPPEIGVLAAVIDRAIVTSYLFVVGGISAGWLWFRSPEDFHRREKRA